MDPEKPCTFLAVPARAGVDGGDVALNVFLFCADAPGGKDEAPAAKIRTKSKARAGNPKNSANVLD